MCAFAHRITVNVKKKKTYRQNEKQYYPNTIFNSLSPKPHRFGLFLCFLCRKKVYFGIVQLITRRKAYYGNST
jgi:hypothetical protein